MNTRNDYYYGGIPTWVEKSKVYQAELKKLQKHYGNILVLPTFEEAKQGKHDVWDKFSPYFADYVRASAAKRLMICRFSISLHLDLAENRTAEQIIKKRGTFQQFLKPWISPVKLGLLYWGKENLRVLKSSEWWLEEEN